jgi:hypothetical protein
VDELLNVGIGTDTPITRLHVQDGSAGNVLSFPGVSARFEGAFANYLHIVSPSNTERGIMFGDSQSKANGGVVFDSSRAPDGLVFRTGGNVDRMRINWLGDTIVHQKLGVGDPTNLPGQVTIKDSGHNALFAISADSSRCDYPTIFASNSAGPSVWAWGNTSATLSGGGDVVVGADTGPNLAMDKDSIMARNGGQAATLYLNAEGGRVETTELFSQALGSGKAVVAQAEGPGIGLYAKNSSAQGYAAYFLGPRVYFGTNVGIGNQEPSHQLSMGGGAYCDGSSWTNASSREKKENFVPVDVSEVLERVASLPLHRWNYKADDAGVVHLGPTSEDFSAAFGLGRDDQTIDTIDAAGVSLAAIQGLHDMVRRQDAEIAELRGRLRAIECALEEGTLQRERSER